MNYYWRLLYYIISFGPGIVSYVSNRTVRKEKSSFILVNFITQMEYPLTILWTWSVAMACSAHYRVNDHKKQDSKETVNDLTPFKPSSGSYKSCSVREFPRGVNVDCSHQDLKQIPSCNQLPVNCSLITEMNLEHNHIKTIVEGVFYNFTQLQTLTLSFNPIARFNNYSFHGLQSLETLVAEKLYPSREIMVEVGVFKELKKLKTLKFIHFWVNINSLFTSLCGLPSYMENIIFDDMYIRPSLYRDNVMFLDSRSTICLKDKYIKNINLPRNNIGIMFNGSLYNLRHTKHLSFQQNKLVGQEKELFYLFYFTNLSSIDLSCQVILHCINPDSPLLSKSRIDYTEIRTEHLSCNKNDNRFSKMIKICALSKLKTLKLYQTNIKFRYFHTYRYLCWVNNLIHLDISYNRVKGFNQTVFCFEKLKYLNIRGVEARFMIPEMFHGMPSLEILQMGKSVRANTFKASSSEQLFMRNKKLKFLDLSENGIEYLDASILKPLRKLRALDLGYNEIKSPLFLNKLIKDNELPLLRYVSLEGNRLTILPMILLTHMEHVYHQNTTSEAYLDISANTFICTCEMIR